MKIHYVTSNRAKFEEAQITFNTDPVAPILLIHSPFDLDELQGIPRNIIEHKLFQAFSIIKEPVIVDDISYSLDALNQLPGPYIRSFLEALGEEGMWDLARRYENHHVTATCHIGFLESNDQKPQFFEASIRGTIVPPRGSTRHGTRSWNAFTQPLGFEKTLGEMTLDEISTISPRGQALRKLKQFLTSHLGAL